jgi:hypothetical protein
MTASLRSLFDENGAVSRRRYQRLIADSGDPEVRIEAKAWLNGLLSDIDPEAIDPQSSSASHHCPPNAESVSYNAPLGLIEGAWLQTITLPATSHQPAVASLFAAYLALLGSNAGASPAHGYRGLMARHGLTMPATASAGFIADPQAGNAAFALGALQLTLAASVNEHFEEVLGYSAGYAASSSPWRLAGIEDERRNQRLRRFSHHVEQAIQHHVAHMPELRHTESLSRIDRGIALFQLTESAYLQRMAHAVSSPPDLARQAAEIIARKAPMAAGYHRNKSLGGCPLDRWFAAQPFDAERFLRAFADSPWASLQGEIRMFERLTGFGGPMFGVFSTEELACIDRWLNSGEQAAAYTEHHDQPIPAGAQMDPTVKLGPRELFHRLVTGHDDRQTSGNACRLVTSTLRQAQSRLSDRGPAEFRFFEYSPKALQNRVHAIHSAAVARIRPFQPPPMLNREEYVWGLRQFAPAVLVDGCWLAGAGLASHQDSPVQRRLLSIYADELGAGHPERHHPAIYRNLLESLDISLPALDSAEFAHSRQFLDSAFDLPVFCLAIGTMFHSHLPEILGLNLAIELSGLGAQYRRLADELEYWGIDATIVRLHQSIDNLASGHAALAMEAIEIYLDDIEAELGDDAVVTVWRRIWTGFLSLSTVTTPLKRALISGFLRQFGWSRFKRYFGRNWRHPKPRPATL